MTTGTIGDTIGHNFNYKSWSGGDGKYNPSGIPNWNEYVMSHQKADHTLSNLGYYAACRIKPALYDRNLEIKALNKVIDKVKAHSFNLAVATAESRQSIRLIKDNLLSVGRAALDVKNGRFSVAAERLLNSQAVRDRLSPVHRGSRTRVSRLVRRSASVKDVGQKWLELQYGWLPLLSDVHEAARAVEARVNRQIHFELSGSSANLNGKWESSESPSLYSNMGFYIDACKVINRAEIQLDSLSSSLGLEDPLTVAWEIVPFSFVADWFIPIGAYLTAANQVPRVLNKLLITRFQRGEADDLRLVHPTLNFVGATSRFSFARMERQVTSGAAYHVPPPQLKTLEKAMSPLHVVNAIALLSVLLSSDKPNQAFNPVSF